jgi:hypothetical protein
VRSCKCAKPWSQISKWYQNFSELEARLDSHDAEIQDLVEAIRELIAPLPASNRRIGFEAPSRSNKNAKPLKARKA